MPYLVFIFFCILALKLIIRTKEEYVFWSIERIMIVNIFVSEMIQYSLRNYIHVNAVSKPSLRNQYSLQRWCSLLQRSSRILKVGCWFPAVTGLNRKNMKWQLYCQTLGNRCKCQGISGITIINGGPVSQHVRHAKESAQLPWIPSTGQNLQPFTGNGDVWIWVKKARVWLKTTNKLSILGY